MKMHKKQVGEDNGLGVVGSFSSVDQVRGEECLIRVACFNRKTESQRGWSTNGTERERETDEDCVGG